MDPVGVERSVTLEKPSRVELETALMALVADSHAGGLMRR